MLSTLLLATSLWTVPLLPDGVYTNSRGSAFDYLPSENTIYRMSQEPRPVPASAFVPAIAAPIEDFGDALAIDLVFNGVGTGADLVSTDWAIENGCVEGNPLIPRVEGRIGAKIGAGAIRGALAYYLRRSGHKTLANVLRYAGAVVDIGLVINNVSCGLRNRK